MPGGGIRVDGITAVVRGLEAIGVRAERPSSSALADIAQIGAQAVGAAAPVLTGYLAGHIHGEVVDGQAQVVATAPYAEYVNYGVPSHHIDAAGFMQAADPVWAPFAVRRLGQDLDTTIILEGLR